jgi:mRNA interferase RelE/StbE
MYRIQFLPSAARSFEKLPLVARRRVRRAIDGLTVNPRPVGAHKLSGAQDVWRLRVGDYRVLYQVADPTLFVLIVKLGHRREVYR